MSEETIEKRIARRQAALDAANSEKANLQALATLLDNHTAEAGIVNVRFLRPVKEMTIGIGRDHVARVFMFDDDIAALRHLLGQENTNEI